MEKVDLKVCKVIKDKENNGITNPRLLSAKALLLDIATGFVATIKEAEEDIDNTQTGHFAVMLDGEIYHLVVNISVCCKPDLDPRFFDEPKEHIEDIEIDPKTPIQ